MVIQLADTSHETLSKIDRYRQAVIEFLLQQSSERHLDNIESQPIFDKQRDRYLILSQGWRDQERIYWVVMHLDLCDGKVWIQRNQTEVDIEAELMALGIPHQDIVRGMIPAQYRTLAGLPG